MALRVKGMTGTGKEKKRRAAAKKIGTRATKEKCRLQEPNFQITRYLEPGMKSCCKGTIKADSGSSVRAAKVGP